ncbi:hypothetical protein LC55x_0153 [Lysobacter capsici]|nr:hypothetical protein LC55x_0153 [Lysobacter capsici]
MQWGIHVYSFGARPLPKRPNSSPLRKRGVRGICSSYTFRRSKGKSKSPHADKRRGPLC